jgi:hypothetical protein
MTYSSFEEFWPDYVRAHSTKLNRTLHAIGVGLALACVAAAIRKKRPWLLLGAPLFGYGFAWCGHFFVEKNMPETFSHPLYSLRASALLFWKTIEGSMEDEVARVLRDEEAETARASSPTAEQAPPEGTTAVN